ncbi:endoplasmic oxidoreductin-1, partial [Ascosphaera acerosa]
MCGNRACAVITLDSEDDIPAVWRAGELSKLEGPTAQHPGKRTQKERPRDSPLGGSLGEDVQERCVLDDDACERGGDDEQLAEAAESTLGTSYDRDYCVPEDDEEAAQWDYVSLVDNPERFTGYSGQGANHVWNAIYRENCYLKPASEEPQDAGAPLSDIRNAIESASARAAVSAAAANQPPSLDDGCYEKRVFHRLVSGMHASISAHLCWEFFDQKAGEWLPNVTCYKTRLHDYPERISNLYFNYALVSQAVAKLGESRALADYQYCAASGAGDIAAATADEQRTTRDKVHALTTAIRAQQQQQGPIFDASVMFRDDGDYALKDDFRARFRNVSRIMDCIGCDKCRLWGKLQTAGYGAALKVLLEFDEPGTAAATAPSAKDFPLRRTEVVALFNTLGRLSKSVDAVRRFEQALTTGDTDVLPSHVLMPLDPAQVAAAEQRSSEEASQLAAAAETLHATGPAGFLEKIRDEADDTPRYFGDEDVREQRQAATGSNPDMSVAEAFMDEFNA